MSPMGPIGGPTESSRLPSVKRRRSGFRISDLWRTPLHDLPIRDEIIHQWLPLDKSAKVLEIGSGSGITALRVSRQVSEITSVDIAAPNIERLQQAYRATANLKFVCADVASPNFRVTVPDLFDTVFGLDFFEYVTNPVKCIENLTSAVRPGGTLLLQWPNYPPSKTGGVNYVATYSKLAELLAGTDLTRWQAYALQLRPHAAVLYDFFHEMPLRRLRRARKPHGNDLPQFFDETWAFRKAHRLESYKTLIHSYWATLTAVIKVGGDCFKRTPVDGDSLNCNLMLLAKR